MKLTKGLSEDTLLHRIGLFCRLAGVGERGLGFYLLDFDSRGLCRKLGFSSVVQFAFIRFQIPQKKTRELLRIARNLDDLVLIDDAFSCGRISWSAVREITRVATKETEKEWLDYALQNNLRRVERAVAQARQGERPPADAYGLTKTKLKVVAELFLEDYALWQAALDRIAAKYGVDLEAGTALLVLAKSYLEKPLDREEAQARRAFQVVYHRCTDCERAWIETGDGPEGVPVETVAAREPHSQIIRLDERRAQRSAIATDAHHVNGKADSPRGTTEWEVAGSGEFSTVPSPAANESGCGHSTGNLVDSPRGTFEGADSGASDDASCSQLGTAQTTQIHGSNGACSAPHGTAETMQEHDGNGACGAPRGASGASRDPAGDAAGDRSGASSGPKGTARFEGSVVPKCDRDIPNTFLLRQKVLSRDGRVCQVPGCRNKAYLSSHHVVFRSHGGATALSNEVAVCASCHGLIHEGRIRLASRAPDRLEWIGPDGAPLSQAHGRRGLVRLAYRRGVAVEGGESGRKGPAEEDTTILSLDEVPAEVDAAWWRKYGHNFEVKGDSVMLKKQR